MRNQAIRLLIVLVVGGISLAELSPVIARADTKLSGEATGWVGTPLPEDCAVENPVVPDDLAAAIEKGAKSSADPNAIPWQFKTESELPTGGNVDSEVLAAASATLWAATGCLNGGDLGRFFTYFSDEGVFQFISIVLEALGTDPHAIPEDQLASLKNNIKKTLDVQPTPVATEERARIDKIRDARKLGDGRVLIVVDGTVTGLGTAFSILRKVENRWLIDAIGIIGDLPTTGL
jgi:hypothetical protein